MQRKASRLSRAVASSAFLLALVLWFASPGLAAAKSNAALVGPKAYYLALGDSLAYGLQPNLDNDDGYADDFYTNLQSHGVTHYANLGCPDETTKTMIDGGCPASILRKYPYLGPQLQAAVHFLHKHAGQVSPVTLDIAANDLIPDLNTSTCTIRSSWASDLATVDTNLTTIILPQLVAAMTVNGQVTGDLLLMNYYDPYQNLCPNTVPYIQLVNQHLLADARGYATIADVFDPFGGAATPNPDICAYTWMCNDPIKLLAIHATDKGYSVMANAFEQAAGY
jgi:lysophospholipase L1-like esterase